MLKKQLKLMAVSLVLLAVVALGLNAAVSRWLPQLPHLRITRVLEPSRATTIESIREVGELIGLKISLQQVVDANSSPGFADFLFGDKLLLVAVGEASYGIDLHELQEGDISFTRNDEQVVLTIKLPEVRVLSVSLNEDETRVYARDTGWLRFRQDSQLESAARVSALQAISEEAQSKELYADLARASIEQTLQELCRKLGIDQVEFVSN